MIVTAILLGTHTHNRGHDLRDARYSQIQTNEGWGDGFGQRFATEDEAHASFAKRAEFGESVAGRRLTRSEILKGVAHPAQDRSSHIADSSRRTRELAGPQPVLASVAEMQLISAQKRHDEALPLWERDLLNAQRAVDSERAEQVRKQALEQLLASPKARKALETVDKLIDLTRYDEAVDQRTIDELQHQRTMLLRFGDSDAASINTRIVQDRLFDAAKASADQAREHADKVSARRDALLQGRDDWDSPPVIREDLLGTKTATMVYAGESVTVPADQFQGHSTEELLSRHFGVTVAE